MPGEGLLLTAEGNFAVPLWWAGELWCSVLCQWLSEHCRNLSMVVERWECSVRHLVLTENPTESTVAGNSQLVQDLPHNDMPTAVCHAIVI